MVYMKYVTLNILKIAFRNMFKMLTNPECDAQE